MAPPLELFQLALAENDMLAFQSLQTISKQVTGNTSLGYQLKATQSMELQTTTCGGIL